MRIFLLKFDATRIFVSMRFFSVAVVVMLSLLACSEVFGPNETVSRAYGDYIYASKEGALESGWLPREIPVSAHEIVESHNVDSNEMWVRFNYENEGVSGFIDGCEVRSNPLFPNARRTRRNAPWWPERLMQGKEDEVLVGYTFYWCPRMIHASTELPAQVAIDHPGRVIWYWVGRQ
ncbi:hypothetical protein M8R20_44325 [Pseudomonas sp. R2.Fl]|nr:hypothetical protein [Pseudomonas sp. R2.Fl]